MDMSVVDQYFELALDLPEAERERMLQKVAATDPATAAEVRRLLAHPDARLDFAASSVKDRRASTVHHVAVQVEDIKAAAEWYASVFGCEVEYQDETWAMLRFDNLRLALVVPQQHPPHLCVVRKDAKKFGPLTAHRDGTQSVYVVDPWGNSVEVMDHASLPEDQR